MSQLGCRNFFPSLDRAPLPLAHRFVQFLERQRAGVSEFAGDVETAKLVSTAGWSSEFVARLIGAYRSQPVAIQRVIAGTTYETPIAEGTLAQHALLSYTEHFAVRFNKRVVHDAENRRRAVQVPKEVPVIPARGEDAKAPRGTLPNVTIVNEEGGIVLITVGADGLALGPASPAPEDPAKRVVWTLVDGTCNEPVFVTDHVLGVGAYRDGRGNSGFRIIRRAAGLPYRFDEDETQDIQKAVYGPADPGDFLEVDADLIEIDSPKDVIDAIEALLTAAEQTGTLLQNPQVTMAAHIARVVVALIEALVDDDAVDVGNIARQYRWPDIEAENGTVKKKKLSEDQWFGYNWDYDFQYVVRKLAP